MISSDGIAIGEITRLFVESDDWRIEALQVKLRKDSAERLGANRSMFRSVTVDIPSTAVQSVGDAVILSVPLDHLRLPEQARPSVSAPVH